MGNAIPSLAKPKQAHLRTIPAIVSVSLEEGERCYRALAFTACAVMCGRALEGICVDNKIAKPLAQGLQELADRKIIDGRLFEWGQALRRQRNLAAHASEQKFSSQDARDLLDFTHAICEYVYVLARKYAEFTERQTKAETGKAPTNSAS